jgi:serine/threonine protein kinase/WD40 repeat protein
MNETSSPAGPDELALVEFIAEYESAADRPAVLARAAADHPHLAGELAGFAELYDRMQEAGAAPAPPQRLEAGRQLGPFLIRRLIGAGGMGEIYLADQVGLDRPVAVKVVRRGRASPELQERFLQEQRVLAKLHHTHIVPIHAAGEEGDLQYFAMPYIEGAALHHVVRAVRDRATTAPGSRTQLSSVVGSLVEARDLRPADAPTGAAPAHAAAPGRLALGLAYFRSVAELLAEAAEALHHAHEKGFVHRDVKPSNLIVDRSGKCWIIDFGLTGCLGPAPAPGANGAAHRTAGPLGTWSYMAPEQYAGRADRRADVWGLGVTLYELLTLRRAFDGETFDAIRRQVLAGSPPRMRGLVPQLPRDLEAICDRALQKGPAKRYATAQELADDLRRWLRYEPTRAGGAWALRRAGLWARRNKGWAAALAAVLAAGLTVASLGVSGARARADLAEQAARHRERELLLQQAQQLRLTPHKQGWAEGVRGRLSEAARLRPGDDARNELAAASAGLDARLFKDLPMPGVTALAFDADGRRLLAAGWAERSAAGVTEHPTHLWDAATDETTVSRQPGEGPVAFRDGVPLQLLAPTDRRPTLLLWDVSGQKAVGEFPLPAGAKAEAKWLALAADGRRLAAAVELPGGKRSVLVWSADSPKPVCTLDAPAERLAFATGAPLLATGDGDGAVSVWSLPTGERLAAFADRRVAVKSLAFGRFPRLRDPEHRRPGPGQGWLLAAGDAGGNISVWDLETQSVQTHLHGSHFDVHGLAFGPDGTVLASTGRTETRLWDVATGRLLLRLSTGNWMPAVAFAPDGRRLAVGHISIFGSLGRAHVWELQEGRGISTLRGLAGQVVRTWFSPDGRRVAALAHDWQAAVWDADTGRLLRLLDVPRGLYADNAALAFSPDGRRLAFSAGVAAREWEIDTGRDLGAWPLRPGLLDALAFVPDGRLILAREENDDGQDYPTTSRTPWPKHRRRLRVHELAGGAGPKLLAEITDLDRHLFGTAISPDGRFLAADGSSGPPAPGERSTRVYDPLTGAPRLTLAVPPGDSGSIPVIDPTGTVLAYRPRDDSQAAALVRLPSGEPLGLVSNGLTGLGPGGRWVARSDGVTRSGIELYRGTAAEPVVTLNLDGTGLPQVVFDVAGTHLAWGNADGSVNVCDIEAVRRRLTALGLGW